jgi:DNA-binding GntR family transcriptional regulator
MTDGLGSAGALTTEKLQTATNDLVALAETSWDHTSRYRIAYLSSVSDVSSALLDAQQDHRTILDCVSSGDAAGAALALADHYERTARAVFAAVDGDFTPVALDEAIASVRLACRA